MLTGQGIQLVALPCTDINQMDVTTATEFGIRILRVSSYSPYTVNEHAVAPLMALDRKTHLSCQRTYSKPTRLADLTINNIAFIRLSTDANHTPV